VKGHWKEERGKRELVQGGGKGEGMTKRIAARLVARCEKTGEQKKKCAARCWKAENKEKG